MRVSSLYFNVSPMTKLLRSNVRVVQSDGFNVPSRTIQEEHARFGAIQTQASWEPGKHNARHGFLNRSRSIWTIIYLLRLRTCVRARVCILHTYAACMDAHLDDTYIHIRMCTLPALLVQYPALLTPSFHGSMARCLECSAPISGAILRFVQSPVPFVPRSPVLSSHLHPVSTSSSSLLRVIQCFASLDSFVLSFVHSCYSCREQPGVSETSMRDSSSFLVSSLRPYPFPFALPFPPPPAPGYPRTSLFRGSVPSPFQSGAFPRLTGIFGVTPFGYR